jgi:hypothetical protein
VVVAPGSIHVASGIPARTTITKRTPTLAKYFTNFRVYRDRLVRRKYGAPRIPAEARAQLYEAIVANVVERPLKGALQGQGRAGNYPFSGQITG